MSYHRSTSYHGVGVLDAALEARGATFSGPRIMTAPPPISEVSLVGGAGTVQVGSGVAISPIVRPFVTLDLTPKVPTVQGTNATWLQRNRNYLLLAAAAGVGVYLYRRK